MIKKKEEREIAIKLRRDGRTYSQILDVVHVAKSTLALWLQSVGLSQKQRITKARLAASMRGGVAKRNQRIFKQSVIISKAKSGIGRISKRELFLVGAVLYWAEGSKEKDFRPGSQLRFANSDPNMIKLFLTWLAQVGVIRKRIKFDIYLHNNNKYRVREVIKYWASHTGFVSKLFKVIIKIIFLKLNARI